MIGCVCQIIALVYLQRVNVSGCKLYLMNWKTKSIIWHVIVLGHDNCSTDVISWPHLLSVAFLWRPLAISGIPLLAPKSNLHISQILIEHRSHCIMCVSVHVPPHLWAPWMEKAMPRSSPISIAWHINGHQPMCLSEGESRLNVLQRGLCFSALCLVCPPLWSHPSWAGPAPSFPTAQLATWRYFNFNSVEKESGAQMIRKDLATNFSRYFVLDP